jgi:transposase
MIFVGIDWAEASHAVCILDEQGGVLARQEIAEGSAGATELIALLAAHASRPAEVVIGIETDRGVLVQLLRTSGYVLYVINPLAASRYRERHAVSRQKSDPGDAKVLADLVRTDRHNHRQLTGNTDLAEGLQVLTRTHQRLIWDRQREVNRLRSALREFYPAALTKPLGELSSPQALAILARAPTPLRGRSLSQNQIAGLLRRAGRERGIERDAAAIQAALRAPQLELPPPLVAAYGTTVTALVAVISSLTIQIRALQTALEAAFEDHPDAEIIASLPGLGGVLGARVLAEFGDDPTGYADSKARKCVAGTAPVTRTSGRMRTVHRRVATNSWLLDACTRWAFSSLTASPAAYACYQAHRDRGQTHQQALRALANRWVGILHGCLRHRMTYDDAVAWPALTMATSGAEPAECRHKPFESTGTPLGSSKSIPASA